MSEAHEVKPVVRTCKGLQDMLFDEIDDLRSGKTTPQSARTVAALSGQLVQTKRLEIDHARFVAEPRTVDVENENDSKALTFGYRDQKR